MADEDTGSNINDTISIIDKMDGFKRYTLILPMEFAFIIVVFAMAWQGHITEALASVTGLLGMMAGYYFGKSAVS